ncbi:MAG TPA: DUF2804 family protein [Solirubrobacteraceae bacterium]|nr:DUF2804 family protein [Solirubrobacteraceae bacterium]
MTRTAEGVGRAPGAEVPSRIFRGTRPLKRWRYVGVFCERFMACAALVHVGPLGQSFWALYDRERDELRERTRLRPRGGELGLESGSLVIRDGARGVALELELDEEPGIEALCPHGRGMVWTRKQAGVAARGRLSLGGGTALEVEARAVIDDTAGHHARHTEWWWSAGVGEGSGGRALAWNLVSGVNDPPQGSERAVWVDSEPTEVEPVAFADDLSSLRCEDGSELRFGAEAQRRRRDELILIASDYRAPFGSFAGELPGRVELVRGLGVMEHHRARW